MGTGLVTLSSLNGQRCYVDANPIIYFLEGHSHFLPQVMPLITAAASGRVTLLTGDAVVAEVMVRPYRQADEGLIRRFHEFFSDTRILTVRRHSARDFDDAARTRASLRMALVDALHLTTARNAGCSHVVTADLRMPSLPGLEVVHLQDLEEVSGS